MYRLQICRDNPFLKKEQGTPLSDTDTLANHQKSCYRDEKPLVQKCISQLYLFYCPYNKKKITCKLKDMNFKFSWQKR